MKKLITQSDYLRVVRKVDREMELEFLGKWTQKTKVHKSKKTYSRKQKHTKEIM